MSRPRGLSELFLLSTCMYLVIADGTGHHGAHGDHGAGGHHDHSAAHGEHQAHAGSHETHQPHVAHQPAPASNYSTPSYGAETYTPSLVTSYLSSGCSKSSESSYVVKQHIDELDYQINSLLATIPQAITEARTAIETNTLAVNRDVLIVGLACLLGAASGSFGILHGALGRSLTNAEAIYLASMNSWGYGYWGPYLLELSDVDPGCGVKDYEKLVYEYNFITSLDQVYGPSLGTGGYAGHSADDRPELRKYYVGEFTRKMKLALHCITSQSGSVEEARTVTTMIDKYNNLANRRLDLTSNVMSY